MPTQGKAWFHITLGTYGSWLPGDPRGFRRKGHRVHSSGDHRSPPPTGEHEGLHVYTKSVAGSTVRLGGLARRVIGLCLTEQAERLGHRLLALAVDVTHVHVLIELPRDTTKHEVGRLKRHASFAVREQVCGRVWARGCGIKRVKDRAHQRATFAYIARHEQEGAWVWTFRGGESEEAHT